ncbi:MAG: hypothetical protein HC778_05150 [Chamaesiphon sp. CSU_1_12]|nr:hypothetical protein [Chamaesiphon sp. CSU_1_12]
MSIWIVFHAGIPWRIYLAMMLGVMTFLVTGMPALAIEYTSSISPDIRADSWGQSMFGADKSI